MRFELRSLLRRPLPVPPVGFRRGPFAENAFRSATRGERTTSLLGLALAGSFMVCFVTGLISHFLQHPVAGLPTWLHWPTMPVWGYRLNQGLHVATGLATIPILLAKLWSIYPKLFVWPPARDLLHGVGRLGLAVLVGTTIFQLLTGLIDVAHWYRALPFFFPDAHYATAWIAIGAICVHVATTLPVVRRALTGHDSQVPAERETGRVEVRDGGAGQAAAPARTISPAPVPAVGRRGFLAGVAVASGAVTLTTLGQTVPALSDLAVFAPRDPRVGPQGIPVNKTAESAGVLRSAVAVDYALRIEGPIPFRMSLHDLRSLPQYTCELPIACVEGWSATGVWTGVRLRDVLALAGFRHRGGDTDTVIRVESLQVRGRYRASEMPAFFADDPSTLLALQLGGEPLHVQHGYPVRLIAPNRPGVLQTKWVSAVTVLPGGDA